MAQPAKANARPVDLLLWAHRTDKTVGAWEDLIEDHKGLRVRGRINLDTQAGKEARAPLLPTEL